MALLDSIADTRKEVAVIGAGPVGTLVAIYMARLGWKVSLYEARPDVRKHAQRGRSINMALSTRGLVALEGAGMSLEKVVMREAIPMRGRMIHTKGGRQSPQIYDIYGECINSVSRSRLNGILLDAAESLDAIEIFFEHKLVQCRIDRGELEFERNTPEGKETIKRHVDFIIGADGAHSAVRRELMRRTRVNYEQKYIEHCYRELTMPAKLNAFNTPEFAMPPNYLHIWPKLSYMLIALPNQDASFTCTLFMSQEQFDKIHTPEELIDFFSKEFPDALELIGRENLCHDYFTNPLGSLMSVKCYPYHYRDRALIIGDAAHSMVPFFGQGMNAGFEDVTLLNEMMQRYPNDLEAALDAYTASRHKDAVAICEMAMDNYIEMRARVRSPIYLVRRTIELALYRFLPSLVIPLYTMVSFTTIPYAEARRRARLQRRWMTGILGGLCVIAGGYLCHRLLNAFNLRFAVLERIPPPPPPPSPSASVKTALSTTASTITSVAQGTVDATVRVANGGFAMLRDSASQGWSWIRGIKA